jgi:transmembrane protein EpsG
MTFYYVVIALCLFLVAVGQALPRVSQRLASPQGSVQLDRASSRNGASGRAASGNHASRLMLVAASLLLMTVGALRWQVGTDYPNYVYNFHRYLVTPLGEYWPWGEPGLPLLAKASAQLWHDYASMFAIAAFITLGLMLRTLLAATPSPALTLLLFICSGAWMGPFNGVRQWLAAAIVVAAHGLVLKRRKSFFVLVAVASMFHVSAVMLVILWILPQRKLSLWQVVLGAVGAYVALGAYARLGAVFGSVRGDDAADLIGNTYYTEALDPLRIAVAFAPLGLYWLYAKNEAISSSTHFYANVAYFNALILLAASGSAYIARFSIYTTPFVALFIPLLLREAENRRTASLLGLAVGALYLVFWYFDTTAQPALLNYQWIGDRP